MNHLYEAIQFENKPIVWNYHSSSISPISGFYHWHQCFEILLIHNGEGSVVFNNQTYQIKKGMLFLFQPFELHKVFAQITKEVPYVRSVFHIDQNIIEGYLRPFPHRNQLYKNLWKSTSINRAIDLGDKYRQVFDVFHLYNEVVKKKSGYAHEEVTVFILQILTIIQIFIESDPKNELLEKRPQKYSEMIMEWLENHYTKEFKLEELAEVIHLSKFYVSKTFKIETGSSITEYLMARRIKEACYLLETTNLPVDIISTKVGLNNSSYFIQLFKKYVGMTPLKYRQSQ